MGMEQEYHFVRNTCKLLGVTLVVYLFMRYLLPATLPFWIAVYLAGALYPWKVRLQKKGEKRKLFQEKRGTSFLMTASVTAAIGVGLYFFARALGEQTKFLLADEITSMLDMITQSQIWNFLIEETERRQIGMLVVSHSKPLLARICSRVIQPG